MFLGLILTFVEVTGEKLEFLSFPELDKILIGRLFDHVQETKNASYFANVCIY